MPVGSASTDGSLRIQTIPGAAIDAVEAAQAIPNTLDQRDWQGLMPTVDVANSFMSPHWFDAWAASHLPRNGLSGPVRHGPVRDGKGRALGFVPLVRRRFFGLEMGNLAGYYWPYRGIPMNTAVGPMAGGLLLCAAGADRARMPALRLGPVRASDAGVGMVVGAFAEAGWRLGSRSLGRNYELRLPAQVDTFLDGAREPLRRAQYYERRMRRAGAVEIDHYRGSGEDWPRVFDMLAAVERRSWVGQRGGDTKFCDARSRKFWALLLDDETFRALLSVWMMTFDSVPVSFFFCFDLGTRKVIIANSYDEDVRDHRTGSILAHHLLTQAVENGCEVVDWGLGDSGYKAHWGAAPAEEMLDYVLLRPLPGLARLMKRQGFAF